MRYKKAGCQSHRIHVM